jgi:hypothetical protein
LHFLSPPRRPRRSGEWTPDKAVTFIVTLAATRSVTLATREAGMSRKSAYALKARDPAFAAAWTAGVNAGRKQRLPMGKGDKADKTDRPRTPPSRGNKSLASLAREQAFSRLLAALRDSAPLAPNGPAQ